MKREDHTEVKENDQRNCAFKCQMALYTSKYLFDNEVVPIFVKESALCKVEIKVCHQTMSEIL